jgi:peroxiredoxin Q/BCP
LKNIAYEKVFVNGIEKEKVIRKGILVDDKGHIIKEWEPLKIEEEIEDVIKVRSLKSH